KMLNANPFNSGRLMMSGLNVGGSGTPYSPPNGLSNGTMTGAPAGAVNGLSPGMSGGLPFAPGGPLQNQSTGGAGNGPHPLGASAHLAPDRNTKHEQLMKLITGMVRPYSWDGMG